jgi:glucose/arabinose dehydrogenase
LSDLLFYAISANAMKRRIYVSLARFAVSHSAVFAILAMACWSAQAQLEDAGTMLTALAPRSVPIGLTNIISASANASANVLALRTDSTVAAWPWNFQTTELAPSSGISNAVAIAAGYSHNVALLRDGTVRQWPATVTPPVPAHATNVSAIAAGLEFTVALRSNGTVLAWGRSSSVTNIPDGLTNVVALAAGKSHALALTDVGNVVAWGFNDFGQRNVPAAATNVSFIAAVGANSVAATRNGVVWRWGEGASVPRQTNTQRELKQIAATRNSTWLLTSQGNLLRWANVLVPWGPANLLGISASESNLYMIARGPVLRSDTDPPTVQSGGFGLNASFVATAESYHPFAYQWFFNGSPLEGATNAILRFVGLRSTDNGAYFVMVTNAYGMMTSAPVTLNVGAGCDQSAATPAQEAEVLPANVEIVAVTTPSGIQQSIVANGFAPATSMALAPDGRIFYCYQHGSVRVIKNRIHLPTPFADVTSYSGGEAGVLGIAFDPGFQSNSFVYVYYTVTSPDRHNRISRFTANGDVAVPCSEKVIFEIEPPHTALIHQGGAIHFGPDGKLYAAVGDHAGVRADTYDAQSLSTFVGKILRLNPDGSIPADNPFYDVASGPYRAIWALGLRNPFTFALDHKSGRMVINDVGSAWEELNEGFAGANYGWPYEQGHSETNLYTNPIHSYLTETNGNLCESAITGAALYNPRLRLLPADYTGSYFFGDFCDGWIRRLDTNGVVHDFAAGITNLVDIDVGPDGALYCLTLGGAIYRFASVAGRFLSTRYLPDNRVDLYGSGVPNQAYILEASNDLQNWQPTATNQSSTAEFHFYDNVATNRGQRFYRLRD